MTNKKSKAEGNGSGECFPGECLKVINKQWEEIKYFKPEEFTCKCGCKTNNVDFELVKKLNRLRDFHRGPLVITSGCRCQKHNKEVGGKPDSFHLSGVDIVCCAVDIRCSAVDRYWLLKDIFKLEFFARIGIGNDFIHLDTGTPSGKVWVY